MHKDREGENDTGLARHATTRRILLRKGTKAAANLNSSDKNLGHIANHLAKGNNKTTVVDDNLNQLLNM